MMLTNGKKTFLSCLLAFVWIFVAIWGLYLHPNQNNFFINMGYDWITFYGQLLVTGFLIAYFEWLGDFRVKLTLIEKVKTK